MQRIANSGTDFILKKNFSLTDTFDTVMPPQMQVNTVHMGPSGYRTPIKIPANSSSYGPNSNKIIFEIQGDNFLDMRNAKLNFFAKVNAPSSATYARFSNGIWNVIKRVIIKNGSEILVDNQSKNEFRSMSYTFARNTELDVMFPKMIGIGSTSERNTYASGKKYSIPLNLPIFEQEELPIWRFKKLTIEFQLAPSNEVIESDQVMDLSYTVEDPYIRCEEVQYQKEITNLYSGRDLYWSFSNYDIYTFQNNGTKFSEKISHNSQGIERILIFIKHSKDYSDPEVNDKFETFYHDDVRSFRFKIKNDYFPKDPVYCSNTGMDDKESYYDAYQQFIENMGINFLNDKMSEQFRANCDIPELYRDYISVNEDEFVDKKFLMCQDLVSYKYNSEDMISKQDWSDSPNVLLDVEFNSQPSEEQIITVVVIYKKVFVLTSADRTFTS